MAKPKQSRRQEFEADLTAVFGDRNDEFTPKLREMLYQLWREGEKRGARDERTRQSDSLANYKGSLISPEDGTMQKRLQEMVAPHPVAEPEKKDTRSTFGKILAGEEPILKVKESAFPQVKIPEFMVTTHPNREFFGQWIDSIQKDALGRMPKMSTTTSVLGPARGSGRLPLLKTQTILTTKKKLDTKFK